MKNLASVAGFNTIFGDSGW